MNQRLIETASFINRHIPDLKNKIICEADLALEGMLILPGSGGSPVFVGNPPMWKENPTPQKDREAFFVLNRMGHWKTLIEAFMLTGDGMYASKVTTEFKDWVQACQRPAIPVSGAGVYSEESQTADLIDKFDAGEPKYAPWRSLEAGFRMFLSWYLIRDCLEDTPYVTEEIRKGLRQSVTEHAEVLEFVSPRLYPGADHNHYLMEMCGLLFAACKFPELTGAGEWRALAAAELERCLARQYTEGGGQLEGCPHYHNECLVLLLRALLAVKEKNGNVCFTRAFEEGLRQALIYTLHTCRPTGVGVPWGDSDATAAPIKSVLYGWFVFGDTELLEMAVRLAGQDTVRGVFLSCIWDCPAPERFEELMRQFENRMRKGEKESWKAGLPLTAWFKPLSQVCIRTAWDREAVSLFFACRLPVQNSHAHMDPGGFDFTAYGRNMIADPGRFTYNEIPERALLKSAFSHTTLTVNGKEPFEYRSSWSYGEQGRGKITEFSLENRRNPGLYRIEAEHILEGYRHQRVLITGFSEVQPFLAVIDRVEGLGREDRVELHFQVNYTRERSAGQTTVFWEPGAPSLIIAGDGRMKPSLRDGWISEVMDQKRPSLILDFQEEKCRKEYDCLKDGGGNSDEETRYFATVLLPVRAECNVDIRGLYADKSGFHMELDGMTYHID